MASSSASGDEGAVFEHNLVGNSGKGSVMPPPVQGLNTAVDAVAACPRPLAVRAALPSTLVRAERSGDGRLKLVSEPRVYEGDIKSWSKKHGYGFIHCPELQTTFAGRDVYLLAAIAPADIKVSDRVSFKVAVNEKGQPYAQHVALVR